MLSTLKAPVLAFLVLTILSLVCASPFSSVWDSEEQDIRSLWSRAVGGKFVGSPCQTNSECYSENCASSSGTNKKTCQRQPVGGPCFKDSNCQTRNCDTSTGLCVDPTKNLPPTSVCQSNASCASQRCLSTQLFVEEGGTGIHQFYRINVDPVSTNLCRPSLLALSTDTLHPSVLQPQCDYLQPGEGPCQTTNQCAEGVCKSSTCKLAKDGERCLYSYQCAGACGADSRCFTYPKGTKNRAGAFCHYDTDCLSNQCLRSYGVYNRTLPNNPSKTVRVPDLTCFTSKVGGACEVSSDCGSGACVKGVCTQLDIGEACTMDSECKRQQCYQGSCTGSSAYYQCEKDNECYSGSCACVFAPGENPCPSQARGCDVVPVGGTCRFNDDCSYAGFGPYCDTNKTCKAL
ncbi:hypothetical protein OC845_000726 [Tilletia horrida]|nr:hypothetical protein OC845_000726 [Tilletia horrida]